MKSPHKLSIIRNFRLSTESFLMLRALSLIYKKKMNHVINDIIAEAFEKEKDHPVTKGVRQAMENNTREALNKSI